MSSMVGPWACTVMEGRRPELLQDFDLFITELKSTFDDPKIREEYTNRLHILKQVTPVITYAAEFEAIRTHFTTRIFQRNLMLFL